MRSWLAGPDDGLNQDDLGKALADYHSRQIGLLAKKLADQHLEDSTNDYDREFNERQQPFTKQELNGRTTTHHRSPEIYEQLSGEGYNYIRMERYDGHNIGD